MSRQKRVSLSLSLLVSSPWLTLSGCHKLILVPSGSNWLFLWLSLALTGSLSVSLWLSMALSDSPAIQWSIRIWTLIIKSLRWYLHHWWSCYNYIIATSASQSPAIVNNQVQSAKTRWISFCGVCLGNRWHWLVDGLITLPQVATEGSMDCTSSPSLPFIKGVTKYLSGSLCSSKLKSVFHHLTKKGDKPLKIWMKQPCM